ncbi:phosphatidylserine decarboxylase [Methylobacterium mesophilicum SR1.6/6]|uniref:phosphatidylserine decarboxylase n=1 Tax=Methylobacterium mesophilicum SR1.6/6 TaxID=908290 RepID=A0A6B9FLW8_9HYPH|nr:archaetidylserine decarboxylase [Methylobacterium mesophilicum]QGY03002.1 phosphatidylserine decarboxylase [Methylobacterium mesophilicum SR1.6/6]
MMTVTSFGLRTMLARVGAQEDLNFLLTNRLPRRLATRFMGWFSRIEQPLVRDISIATWRLFCDVDLSDAREARFPSLHAAFVRALRPGTRPVEADPAILVSPCDAILGAHGRVEAGRLFQVKGLAYRLAELLGNDEALARAHEGGSYATLRLTAGMYHRFHAPHDLQVQSVRHIWGDTWNVNPIALKRVEALFCRNERAVIRLAVAEVGHAVTLVPVAAILVAGLRLGFLPDGLSLRATGGATLPSTARLAKGAEMGWFEHGSTIVVLAPAGFELCPALREGTRLRMGEALMRLPEPARPTSDRPPA